MIKIDERFKLFCIESLGDSNQTFLSVLRLFEKFTNNLKDFQEIHVNMIDYFNYIYVNMENEILKINK